MTYLDLGTSKITDTGAQQLAEALKVNKVIPIHYIFFVR